MTERSIKVTLRANVADFNRQIKSAATSLDQLAAKGDPTGKAAETTMGRLAQSAQLQRAAWDTASTAMVGYGVAAAAAAGYVVKSFADFDQAMSNVQAATHESAANMDQLREAAIQAGADTAFSASEAAGAIEELAKAGVSTADILNGGLKGSLDLAAAGGLGVADAAGIASVALTQFKLSGSDVGHVADLLAAGAGKAMGDVSDLGMALKQAGLVASQTGLSIEETTGALAAFAAAGLLGSDAGTSFKTMLLNMTPQSKQAAKYMEELGIHAYDAQGQFVGLAAYAGQLHDSLSKLTAEDRQAALKKMFGQDAIRAASILYEQGAEGIQSWIDQVNDAGYAAETAEARMDNLNGDLEKLGGSFETLFIKSGSGANDFLRSIVQFAEQAVNAFSALPAPVQQGALGLAAFTSAAALTAGAGMKVFTMITDVRTAMQSLNGSVPFLTRIMDGFSGMRGGLAETRAAISGFGNAWVTARANGVSNVNALAQAATPALAGIGNAAKGAGNALLGAFGGPWGLAATAAVVGLTAVLGEYQQQQAAATARAKEYAGSLDEITRAATDTTREIAFKNLSKNIEMIGLMGKYETNRSPIKAFKELGGDINDFVDAAAGSTEAMNRVQAVFDRYNAMADGVEKTKLSVAYGDAKSGLEEQITALAKAKEENDLAAEAGVKNASAQDQLAGAANRAQKAMEDQAKATHDLIDAQKTLQDIILGERGSWRNLYDAIDAANAAVEKNGQTLDITTAAGRANQAALDDLAKSGWELVESMEKNGATMEDMQAAMTTTRDNFIAVAQAMGLSAEDAAALADQLNLIPTNIESHVTAETEAANASVDAFIAYVQAQNGGTITINAVNDSAITTILETLGYAKNQDGTITIDANNDPAIAELVASVGEVDAATGTVTIDGNNEQANAKLDAVKAAIDGYTPYVNINANDYVSSKMEGIKATWNGQNWYVNIIGQYSQSGGPSAQADGSVLSFYAGGGFHRERHVAQIAPAGAWRVWAEPETGGEGYIPLAKSKRTRSEAILGRIADIFGGTYIPGHATPYATGGVGGNATGAGSATVHVTALVTNPWTGEQARAFARTEAVKVVRSVQ
ncbi:phage tail tape measure protein [uncultured Actinomyces sp.]|uniref:phage tail tape measure protein n=1 Tax=uncultured Actinomyces sp. TaxID=249061 RepID=UPI002670D3F0|nr:phage tail tape measure protein [uncultured Actinomyces sp.]